MLDSWQDRYLERFYRGRRGWVNGTEKFHQFIAEHLRGADRVLELGPGPSGVTTRFLRSRFALVDGLDVDEAARANTSLCHFFHYQGGHWPLPDCSYDAVVSDYVLEHLSEPRETIGEACRVLRPGGVFAFRTPNLWHYVSLVGRCTSLGVHIRLSRWLRQIKGTDHDPYPTHYLMNTQRGIRRLCRSTGFEELCMYTMEKEPSYGMSSRALFLVFMAYERLVNGSGLLAPFRANIIGVFRKPTSLGCLDAVPPGGTT